MPYMSWFPPGAPSWAELASPRPAASRDFYGGLFGWTDFELTVDTLADYTVFTLGGVRGPAVAGMQYLADPGQRAVWGCYFRTDDLPATLACVDVAGGGRQEPFDVASLGRTAYCHDDQGADFSLWLPYDMQGAALFGEPAALDGVELSCPDLDAARRFYGTVFGWSRVRDGSDEVTCTVDGAPAAVLTRRAGPAGWEPRFRVADCDAAASRARELGGVVRVPPHDTPRGRRCLLTDPQGAGFSLVAS